MAQWVERPTSAQVMISRFVSSSPASGSVLTAQSLEPASNSVSPSLSVLSPLARTHSLSEYISKLKKIYMMNYIVLHNYLKNVLKTAVEHPDKDFILFLREQW